MRTPFALLLALVSLAAEAAPARGAPRPTEPITVRFLPAGAGSLHGGRGGATVDLGTISAGACRRSRPACGRSIVARREVRVLLESRSAAPRFAKLRASLAGPAGGTRVRVDGILLSPVPQLIDPSAPLGSAVPHVIEVEVPASEPAGRLEAAITWTADAD